MSAHFGQPGCKWNEVIDRMDYLGPVANRARRFIQVTEDGQIVVSEDFLDELQRSNTETSTRSVDDDEDDEAVVEGGRGGAGPLFAAATRREDNVTVAARTDEEDVELNLKDLPMQDPDGESTEKHFEVKLLGKRHFKGLEEMQKLYFIIPYSLRGRVEYWPRHTHVPGSKGNLVEP